MRRLIALLTLAVIVVTAIGVYALQEEPGWYIRARYPLNYESIIRAHADNYGLDPALVAAVIYTESSFDANATSAAGARGLMQLLPQTAQGIADRTGGKGFVVADLYDPEINIRYGSWYFSHLRDKYANHPQATDLALAAYNAGQGNVDAWVAATSVGEPVEIRFQETRAYIAKVKHIKQLYQRGYNLR